MEFKDLATWHKMHEIRENMWIYLDPTNRLAALADPARRILYSVMDRKTKEIIWEDKKALKARPKFRGRRLNIDPILPRY